MPMELLSVLIQVLGLVLGVPSAIGAGAYFVSRKLKPTPTHLLAALGCYFLITICVGAFIPAMFLLMIAAVISKAGAWAHTKSVAGLETGWESPYHLVMLASVFALLIGGPTLIGIYLAWTPVFSVFPELFVLSYFVALVLAPSLMPFLIWMLQSMKLRSGMDKHF